MHTADPAASAGEEQIEGRSLSQIAWGRLRRDKVALAGGAFIVLLVTVAIFAPLITKVTGGPPNEYHQDLLSPFIPNIPAGRFGGMSWEHPMGLETVNGRDIFSRVLYGARVSLLIAILATMLSVIIGTTLGIISGFFGGWVDAFLSRLMDIFLAFPLLIFAIALSGVIPDKAFGLEGLTLRLSVLVFVIGFFSWPYIGRIVRGQTISLREREYVEAARSLGATWPYILRTELLAQPDGADPRLLHADHPDEHPVRGRAVLPRGRRSAADRQLGRHAHERLELVHGPALHVLARPGDLRHGAGLQPLRGRAARCVRPQGPVTSHGQPPGNQPRS